MVPRTTFFGNAVAVTLAGSTLQVGPFSERVIRVNATSAGAAVKLPDATKLKTGATHFVVYAAGANAVAVKDRSGGTVLASIPSGSVATVWLESNETVAGTWRTNTRVVNTAVTSIAVGDIALPSEHIVDNNEAPQDCGDVCDPAAPTVPHTVPMYMNPVVTAKNEWRDAIRAADLLLPKKIELSFTEDMFTQDSAHTHAETISPGLLTVLTGSKHQVEWDNNAPASGSSRHWHHIDLTIPVSTGFWNINSGGDPEDGTAVYRLFWTKTIDYEAIGKTHTLEIRFVAEWAQDPEAHGAWGALFHVYVFSSEINAAYGEGDPDPDQENIPFTRDDPAVWGPIYSAPRQKYFHPQGVLCACVPTTFQAPFGGVYVPFCPPDDTSSYDRTNGAPWTSSPVYEDAAYNSAFSIWGESNWKAMTLGGDAPTSELYPFFMIENGDGGYGLTVLKPTNAGWVEATGVLDTGSDLVITDCTPDQTSVAISPCDGHPDDPYLGVGGTHRCLKLTVPGEPSTFCCVPIGQDISVEITQKCVYDFVTLTGADDGFGGCEFSSDAADSGTRLRETYHVTHSMEVENYIFNPSNPSINWVKCMEDPDDPMSTIAARVYFLAETGLRMNSSISDKFAPGYPFTSCSSYDSKPGCMEPPCSAGECDYHYVLSGELTFDTQGPVGFAFFKGNDPTIEESSCADALKSFVSVRVTIPESDLCGAPCSSTPPADGCNQACLGVNVWFIGECASSS